MSTTVRKSGLTGTNNRWNTRAAFTLSDGSSVVVVHDTNAAGADVGYGDRNGTAQVYVYQSTDRVTWTLRTTLAMPLAGAVTVTANVSDDNSIGIVVWSDTAVRYARVASTWVAGAWETPRAALTGSLTEYDFDLTFVVNVPVICALRSSTAGSTRLQSYLYTRETTTNTWIASLVATHETAVNPKRAYQAVSLVGGIGGTAAARNMVLSVAHGTGATDRGIRLYTLLLNVTNGVVSSVTLRKTYLAGEIPGTTTAVSARNVKLFLSDDNEYTLGWQHLEGGKKYGVTVGTWDGAAWTEKVQATNGVVSFGISPFGMAMTYSSGRLVAHYSSISGNLASYIVKINSEIGLVTLPGSFRFIDNKSRPTSLAPLGGGGPHVHYPTHDLLFIQKITNTRQEICHWWVKPTRAPVNVGPANNATIDTSTPALRAEADLDVTQAHSLIKIRWEFATDAAFTTNFNAYEQGDDKFAVVANTDLVGSTVPFADVLPDHFALPQGAWYVRACHVDEFGVRGTFSPANPFTIAHPPAAARLTPDNQVVIYDGLLELDWTFTDPYPKDKQTAFEVLIERNVDGTLVHDSQQIVSTGRYAAPIAATEKDVELRWAVKLWDKDNVPGAYSPYARVTLVDPSSVAITSPVNGALVTTAIPNISFTVTVGGVRTIKFYRIAISRGGEQVYSTGLVTTSLNSGDTVNWQPPIELLANNATYTVDVKLIDSAGIPSNNPSVSFTTGWVPPAFASGQQASVAPYNAEGQGWVAVTWTDTARDPDWTGWSVYRKVDMIDPTFGTILTPGVWERVATITTTAATYLYKDFYAPSNYQVSYRVEQQVSRFGDVLESNTAPPLVTRPQSDSYWVIEPEWDSAFQLGSVTGDDYTDAYDEAEFFVIGRGTHVDQGERLGYKGTLTTKIRDRPGASARQRKQRLEMIKRDNRKLFLRNPYGDIFRVSVGTMSVSRIAGVGSSEFIDVTIPYTEVGE